MWATPVSGCQGEFFLTSADLRALKYRLIFDVLSSITAEVVLLHVVRVAFSHLWIVLKVNLKIPVGSPQFIFLFTFYNVLRLQRHRQGPLLMIPLLGWVSSSVMGFQI